MKTNDIIMKDIENKLSGNFDKNLFLNFQTKAYKHIKNVQNMVPKVRNHEKLDKIKLDFYNINFAYTIFIK